MPTKDQMAEICILIFAGIVKGATGVGMPVVAIPLLSAITDLKRAIGLIAIPLVITNIAQGLEGGRTWNALRPLTIPILAFLPGCAAGILVLLHVSEGQSKAVAGLMLIVTAAMSAVAKRGKRFWVDSYTRSAGAVAGLGAGLIAGMSGVAGPPVFIYMLGFEPQPREFTKSAALFLIAANFIMAVMLMRGTRMPLSDMMTSALASVPVFAGMLIGQSIRDRISVSTFRTIVLGFVVLSGANLALRGVLG